MRSHITHTQQAPLNQGSHLSWFGDLVRITLVPSFGANWLANPGRPKP